jgi:hypothetical protein
MTLVALAYITAIIGAGLLLRGIFWPSAGFFAFAAALAAWRLAAFMGTRR